MPDSSSDQTSATQTATTSTTKIVAMFNAFENINWGEIAAAAESKFSNLNQDVATVEHVADVLVSAATVAGVPFAATVKMGLPIAEKLIGIAETFVPALRAAAPAVVLPPTGKSYATGSADGSVAASAAAAAAPSGSASAPLD